jgi:predicted transcriptional regulator
MSAHDYERLGIIAVKAAMSRHQLLKKALAQFIAARAQDYSCACLGDCQRNCENQS